MDTYSWGTYAYKMHPPWALLRSQDLDRATKQAVDGVADVGVQLRGVQGRMPTVAIRHSCHWRDGGGLPGCPMLRYRGWLTVMHDAPIVVQAHPSSLSYKSTMYASMFYL